MKLDMRNQPDNESTNSLMGPTIVVYTTVERTDGLRIPRFEHLTSVRFFCLRRRPPKTFASFKHRNWKKRKNKRKSRPASSMRIVHTTLSASVGSVPGASCRSKFPAPMLQQKRLLFLDSTVTSDMIGSLTVYAVLRFGHRGETQKTRQ
nr:uncharacterized protein LOC129387601 [Dermacentor andersoni]